MCVIPYRLGYTGIACKVACLRSLAVFLVALSQLRRSASSRMWSRSCVPRSGVVPLQAVRCQLAAFFRARGAHNDSRIGHTAISHRNSTVYVDCNLSYSSRTRIVYSCKGVRPFPTLRSTIRSCTPDPAPPRAPAPASPAPAPPDMRQTRTARTSVTSATPRAMGGATRRGRASPASRM